MLEARDTVCPQVSAQRTRANLGHQPDRSRRAMVFDSIQRVGQPPRAGGIQEQQHAPFPSAQKAGATPEEVRVSGSCAISLSSFCWTHLCSPCLNPGQSKLGEAFQEETHLCPSRAGPLLRA